MLLDDEGATEDVDVEVGLGVVVVVEDEDVGKADVVVVTALLVDAVLVPVRKQEGKENLLHTFRN